MTEEASFGPMIYPFFPTSEYNGPRPQYLIVREIDFELRGQEDLVLFFSRGANIDLTNSQDQFEEIVDKVCNLTFAFPATRPRLTQPYKSTLSLSNNRLSYVIYVLTKKNWQFARRGWPITVMLTPTGRYYGARRADASGYVGADSGQDIDGNFTWIRDDCHVAFFIADGRSPAPDGDNINLHVDLTFRDLDQNEYYMPLIIDPDIRWPGGSEP